MTQHISRTELQEGDLLFFNTRGGVSHVGIYLQNNKFVHASISGGVTISDMFEPYYVKHFIASGRVKGIIHNSSVSVNP
jgi:lipoprotein Spr